MSFAVGSLVKARGREWVVLPESQDDVLVLRPLGGTDDEVAGIYLPLETVEPARFGLPDPTQPGDYQTSKLLRDAVRLGFRSSAGPFRSFAKIAVEPRPYQLVPLLMALKLDPVRLLIADDVGIGKTVEACLVARELIDRAEVERLAVLCPPQLAEQWQAELRDKFHIDAELVLPSTVTRLERNTRLGESLFDIYPYVIVSTDFIKSDRRRDEFLRTCPELVIVDEAHTCAFGGERRGGRHQRYELVRGLAANPDRHMLLVTATPHSGNEQAFRSLLELLDPAFADLPENLTGTANEAHRRRLAAHFVQRRRGDIQRYLDTETPFPVRAREVEDEQSYKLSEGYRRLFEKVLRYARESVLDSTLGTHRQRVRWWSALALLRSLASSPAAAAATLRSRAASADTETAEEADEIGRRTVLDLVEDEAVEGIDVTPGSDPGDEAGRDRRRLLDLAREADALAGAGDNKLKKIVQTVDGLLREGYQPIVFCRFIPTAEYVAAELREKLPRGVEVAAVTGTLPPTEREARVAQLGEAPKRVLVCTDCLSEGINLQQYFNAVVHYDLAWNPTRHEQREGRVDRYGQPSSKIRVISIYGVDNQIDGIVLDVLLRKHKKIRSSLGISVPVPVNAEQIVEAVFEGLLLREGSGAGMQQALPGFDELLRPQEQAILRQWDVTAEREKQSRTIFNQAGINVDEVAAELAAVRRAIGSGVDVAHFVRQALMLQGAAVRENGVLHADLTEVPVALQDMLDVQRWSNQPKVFQARFELPVQPGEIYLSRTHPIVEGLATYSMDTALDPLGDERAPRRCGVIRTRKVATITTALLLRFRYHIITERNGVERPLLAEDLAVAAFEEYPDEARWLNREQAEALFQLEPEANVPARQATEFLSDIISGIEALTPDLERIAVQRGEELLAAHRRVRTAARMRGVRYRVVPQLPPDVLAVYVYLPTA